MSNVGPIVFSDPTARQQLVEHGTAVTFRPSDRTTGPTWWRETRTGPKRGDVTVERVKAVCPHGTGRGLQPYVDDSGFDSVAAWQTAIRRLHDSMPAEGWLYRATLDDLDDAEGGA